MNSTDSHSGSPNLNGDRDKSEHSSKTSRKTKTPKAAPGDSFSALKVILDSNIGEITGIFDVLAEKMRIIEEKESRWEQLQSRLRDNFDRADVTIKLNVRGKIFETFKENLLRVKDSYFYGMLGSGNWRPNKDGAYFIDRRYEGFERILDYLVTGKMSYDGLSDYECEVIRDNLEYFHLDPRVMIAGQDEEYYEDYNFIEGAEDFVDEDTGSEGENGYRW